MTQPYGRRLRGTAFRLMRGTVTSGPWTTTITTIITTTTTITTTASSVSAIRDGEKLAAGATCSSTPLGRTFGLAISSVQNPTAAQTRSGMSNTRLSCLAAGMLRVNSHCWRPSPRPLGRRDELYAAVCRRGHSRAARQSVAWSTFRSIWIGYIPLSL